MPVTEDIKVRTSTPNKNEQNIYKMPCTRFNLGIDLEHHVKTNHCKVFSCDQCEAEFPSSWQLECHMKAHGTKGNHQCATCGKYFHVKWRLEKHIKMHEGESEFRKCHFYNNGKDCPYEEIGCKFLHQESTECKFKRKCKFDRCQFRH